MGAVHGCFLYNCGQVATEGKTPGIREIGNDLVRTHDRFRHPRRTGRPRHLQRMLPHIRRLPGRCHPSAENRDDVEGTSVAEIDRIAQGQRSCRHQNGMHVRLDSRRRPPGL
jgi:hypothetical protein